MPELPEVETVCRGLAQRLVGRRLRRVEVRRADLRQPVPPDFAARLTGRRVLAVDRRAKYMLWHLDDEAVVLGHLGMSGRLAVKADPAAPPATHDHVRFETDDELVVVYNDPRRFGFMLLSSAGELDGHPMLAGLGTVSILYGAVGMVAQSNLRVALAYASICHVGLAILGLASYTAQGAQGAVSLLLSFSVSSGGAFLLLEFLRQRVGSTDVHALGGAAKTMPMLATGFLICGLVAFICGLTGGIFLRPQDQATRFSKSDRLVAAVPAA